MKYKVGDKVRVREDLVANKRYGHNTFVPEMKEYLGKTMTIACININGSYTFKGDPNGWHFTDEMIESEDINIFVDGNKVIAKKGNTVGIAKCSPEDKFDIFIGARLAIDRLEKECKPYSWLKNGVRYYYPSVGMNDLHDCCTYTNASFDKRLMSRGLVFKTKEEAVAAAKKMLAVLKEGEDDEV